MTHNSTMGAKEKRKERGYGEGVRKGGRARGVGEITHNYVGAEEEREARGCRKGYEEGVRKGVEGVKGKRNSSKRERRRRLKRGAGDKETIATRKTQPRRAWKEGGLDVLGNGCTVVWNKQE